VWGGLLCQLVFQPLQKNPRATFQSLDLLQRWVRTAAPPDLEIFVNEVYIANFAVGHAEWVAEIFHVLARYQIVGMEFDRDRSP